MSLLVKKRNAWERNGPCYLKVSLGERRAGLRLNFWRTPIAALNRFWTSRWLVSRASCGSSSRTLPTAVFNHQLSPNASFDHPIHDAPDTDHDGRWWRCSHWEVQQVRSPRYSRVGVWIRMMRLFRCGRKTQPIDSCPSAAIPCMTDFRVLSRYIGGWGDMG